MKIFNMRSFFISFASCLVLLTSFSGLTATPYLSNISGGLVRDSAFDESGNLYLLIHNQSTGLTIDGVARPETLTNTGVSLIKLNSAGTVVKLVDLGAAFSSTDSTKTLKIELSSDKLYLLTSNTSSSNFMNKYSLDLVHEKNEWFNTSADFEATNFSLSSSGTPLEIGVRKITKTPNNVEGWRYQVETPQMRRSSSDITVTDYLVYKREYLHGSELTSEPTNFQVHVPMLAQAVVSDATGNTFSFHGIEQIAHGYMVTGKKRAGNTDFNYIKDKMSRAYNIDNGGDNYYDDDWHTFLKPSSGYQCATNHGVTYSAHHYNCIAWNPIPILNSGDNGHYNRVDGLIKLPKKGTYKFKLTNVDDWARIIVNRNKNQTDLTTTTQTSEASYTLDAGFHFVTVEHWDIHGGGKSVKIQVLDDNDNVVLSRYLVHDSNLNSANYTNHPNVGDWFWPNYIPSQNSAAAYDNGSSISIPELNTSLRGDEAFRPTEYDTRNSGRTIITKRNSQGVYQSGLTRSDEIPVDAIYANSKIYVLVKMVVPNSDLNATSPVKTTGLKLYALDSSLNKIANAEAIFEMQSGAVYNGEAIALEADNLGNIYLMATLEPSVTADFKSSTSVTFGNITTGQRSFFVAKLDSNLNWQWYNKPDGFTGTLDISHKFPGGLTVQPTSGDVYVSGYFKNGKITLKDTSGDLAELTAPATENKSFMLALNSSGKWSTRATVSIKSDYATSLVYPGIGNFNYLKGSTVEVSAPDQYYIDKNGHVLYQQDSTGKNILDSSGDKALVTDPNDPRAVTRYTCTGYDLEDQVVSGESCRYSFTFNADVSIEFNWQVEHILDLQTNITNLGYTLAQPNPEPTIGRHWIKEGEQVTLQIDGAVVNSTDNNKRVLLDDIGLTLLDERKAYAPFTNSGEALALSGTSAKVSLPTIGKAAFDGDFTVEFWVKTKNNSKSYANRIVDFATSDTSSIRRDNLLFGLNGSDKKPEFYILNKTQTGYPRLHSTIALKENEWQHLALTYDRSETTATFYINGQFAGAKYDMPLPSSIDRNASFIGSTNWQYFEKDFEIDEFRLWRSARTETEIRNNLNSSFSTNQTNLEYYLRFEEKTATLASQYASNTNSASISGLNNGASFKAGEIALPLSFSPSDQRQQPLSLSFNAPLQVDYNWQTQYAVSINTSASKYESLPLVQTLQSGSVVQITENAGKYWIDENDHIRLLMPAASGLNQLKGWQYASGLPDDGKESGTITDIANTTVIDGVSYYYINVDNVKNAVGLTWEMEILTLKASQAIGSSISLADIIDANLSDNNIKSAVAALKTSLTNNSRLDVAPFSGFVITGNADTYQDMVLWAGYDKKLYPLIPGKLSMEWSVNDPTQGNDAETFRVELTTRWPSAEHYPYVIDTPAILLDRNITDSWAFVKLAYSEVESNVGVVNGSEFSFSRADDPVPLTVEDDKQSVLIFTCTDKGLSQGQQASVATGDTANESVCVRVVQLKPQSIAHSNATAPVGDVLKDSEHNAPHSGYIESNLARYNPYIYQPESLSGPIIPVNRNFINDDIEQLFEVYWYKNYNHDSVFEPVYWPFKKVRYSIRWPEKLNGNDDPQALQRIVIASRLGSDGKNALRVAEQQKFDPSKFEEISLYNQSNKNLPGYNPNEEHGLLEASYRYRTESPRPQAAFALRNDLNVITQDDKYTSDPYVLVQYKDTSLNPADYRMKVYKVEMEDENTFHNLTDASDSDTDSGSSNNPDADLVSGLTATYYYDNNLTKPIHRELVNQIQFTTTTAPHGSLPNDNYSIRYQGKVVAEVDGEHEFSVSYDDGVRFWFNDEQVINDWNGGGTRTSKFKKTLVKGQSYEIKLEYFELTFGAHLDFKWQKPSTASPVIVSAFKTKALEADQGYRVAYYNNTQLSGVPVAVETIDKISFSTNSSPKSGVNNDNFSARYYGSITPDLTGEYTLVARNDDGVRVWLDNKQIIDDWRGGAPRDNTHKVNLVANTTYQIKIEYYEAVGGAELQFKWIKPLESNQSLIEGAYAAATSLDDISFATVSARDLAAKAASTPLPYTFSYPMKAGEPIVAPYPVNVVQGVQISPLNWGHQGASATQNVYWEDHKGQSWAISGGSELFSYTWYPMQPSFWWPADKKLCYNQTEPADYKGREITSSASANVTCHTVTDGTYLPLSQQITAENKVREVEINFKTEWPAELPLLKAGETLTYSGGEAEEDGIAEKGLPGVLAFAAGQIVYDDVNKLMGFNTSYNAKDKYSARLAQVLEKRTVKWPTSGGTAFSKVPEFSLSLGKVKQLKGLYFFTELPASLQDRIYYDPLTKELVVRGFLDGKTLGDETLTAAPGAIYSLLPNILTTDDVTTIKSLTTNTTFHQVVDQLYALSRDPSALSGIDFGVGLELNKSNIAIHASSLGAGLALMPSAGMLDPNSSAPDISYVTIAENNHKDLGSAPVSLHIVKLVKKEKYRGELDVLYPPNVFDEKINLRHTADFGANGSDMVFEWKYRPDNGKDELPPDQKPTAWKPFSVPNKGLGQNEIALQGATAALLADNLFFARYRHTDCVADDCWSDWAGAANNKPSKNIYKAQLSEGWVKRVIDRVNAFESRINDFYSSDSPATYSSMIQQAGQRFNGAVALNSDKDVIENVGLIQLYQTVLERARLLSIDASQPTSTSAVNNALQLAATRLAQLYTLLGNEAYVDALDPTIGFTTESGEYGSLAPSIFSFKNQMPSMIQEELSLLRGRAEYGASPAFNRLIWNFTIGDGEVAYALNYNIKDVDDTGFIDEDDARTLYPQGHGDAWGHFTMGLRYYYDLIQNENFKWVPRAEKVLIDGVTVDVDFTDEQRFAEIAAARAKTGRDIVDMTYRASYVEDADGQWQGYKDRDSDRAWGVTEWAQRASTGAYMDWLMANSMLPAQDSTYSDSADIRKVDRSTVPEIQQIATQAEAINALVRGADKGQNPLGLAPDIVPFDIDPVRVDRKHDDPATHFEQVAERAEEALDNAFKVFDYANTQKNRIREVADSAQDMLEQAQDQDRDFKNRLIEVFGTPYEGTIGSGKTYAAGYEGPDLYFYQYIDANDISNEAAPVVSATGGNTVDKVITSFYQDRITRLSGIDPTDNSGISNLLTDKQEIQIDYPITAADYSFQAPDTWGIRRAPGKIQAALADMVRAQADYNLAFENYGDLVENLEFDVKQLKDQYKFNNDIIEMRNDAASDVRSFNAAIGVLKTVQTGLNETRDFVRHTATMAADALPKNAGLSVDVGSPGRAAVYASWAIADPILSVANIAAEGAIVATESEKEIAQIKSEIEIEKKGYTFEVQQKLKEIEYVFTDDEPTLRLEMYKARETLRQAGEAYRTVLAEGLRLLDEREALNKRIAAKAQGERYKDMTFRIGQYDALQKYRAAFDLASRYVYMAARVYDYETNLAENDPASAQHLLTQIVSERVLGEQAASGAVSGQGGLSEVLSTLKVNFDVLKTQMGFNNPQTESGRFSLRHGLFRIPNDSGTTDDDQLWRNTLAQYKVDDLWDVPEFRRFVRNFAPESAGSQPGLVIPFSSTIEFGKNFFGWPLSGGDHAYDASNFATKVRSVGVWFDDYNNSALSTTPRVYLVPVGLDVMYVPDSLELDTREWEVVDQVIPVPLPARDSDLNSNSWIPSADSVSGSFDKIRRHSSFRAYHDSGVFDVNSMTFDSRLVGRSVWNTRWMLIIPGGTFLANSDDGMNTFIYGQKVPGAANASQRDGNGVSDIKLFFQTYSYSGN
ncbi:PA14 domain-containing protein [Catenovulum maritimum]|uniref:PA14 domain-containing protein n=1 Tax=Catenovulum maritimum TaxID=1513271 RepID=A0A0J8JIP6_9ALTE|nr:PA14 domain-containing protein [Catenovulum maritimum]KMT64331.1 hypothetical protein XM47_15170 [Catenovulum maritimum]